MTLRRGGWGWGFPLRGWANPWVRPKPRPLREHVGSSPQKWRSYRRWGVRQKFLQVPPPLLRGVPVERSLERYLAWVGACRDISY